MEREYLDWGVELVRFLGGGYDAGFEIDVETYLNGGAILVGGIVED